ncbi:MAG: DUF2087 domain-containing protein [Pseudomonadota bacterium]
MSRTPLPLVIEDVAKFADALRRDWPDAPPGHLSAMNLVARAAGYRSWQVLKATTPTPDVASDEELRRVQLALRVFDAQGRMHRWPKGHAVQGLCLAVFWSRIPSHRDLREKEINAILKQGEVFGDHVLLRRSLVDHGLVRRTNDGFVYRRVERRPGTAELSLIRTVSARWYETQLAPAEIEL